MCLFLSSLLAVHLTYSASTLTSNSHPLIAMELENREIKHLRITYKVKELLSQSFSTDDLVH